MWWCCVKWEVERGWEGEIRISRCTSDGRCSSDGRARDGGKDGERVGEARRGGEAVRGAKAQTFGDRDRDKRTDGTLLCMMYMLSACVISVALGECRAHLMCAMSCVVRLERATLSFTGTSNNIWSPRQCHAEVPLDGPSAARLLEPAEGQGKKGLVLDPVSNATSAPLLSAPLGRAPFRAFPRFALGPSPCRLSDAATLSCTIRSLLQKPTTASLFIRLFRFAVTSRRLSELPPAFARAATCGTYALPLPLPSMSFVLEYVTPHRTLPVNAINNLVTSSRLTRSSTVCSWQHCPSMHTSSPSLQPYRPTTAPPSASNSCTTTSTL